MLSGSPAQMGKPGPQKRVLPSTGSSERMMRSMQTKMGFPKILEDSADSAVNETLSTAASSDEKTAAELHKASESDGSVIVTRGPPIEI